MLTLVFLLLGMNDADALQSKETSADKPKVVCRYEKDLSSRIVRRKICQTADERRSEEEAIRRAMGGGRASDGGANNGGIVRNP